MLPYVIKNRTSLRSCLLGNWFPILLLFYLLIPFSSSAQEYGLEFQGQPFSKDNRTELDLNPDGYFTFLDEFELSFSIQIRENQPSTFGYIARIVDVDGNNIDIIFNGPNANSLHVVYGKSLTSISVTDNGPEIFEQWTEIRLKLNIKKKSLQFSTPDTSLLQYNIDFSRKIKIFFGGNAFSPIQTTDVPTMNIKDIRLYYKGKCMNHFPLNETSGYEAKDVISNYKAVIQNPVWIKNRFYKWVKLFDTYLSGFSAICFDPRDEKIYLVGDEQMKIFLVYEDSIPKTIEYSSRFNDLIRGSRMFYDTISDRLICYNLKIKTVHFFNFTDLQWEKISDGPNISESFLYHNKYYSSPDSTLYVFGGYGQHKYSNLVQRYQLQNNQWDTILTTGDTFHPRMHAAFGKYADTLYILGGFGSKSGDQILNPEHYTDLMAYSIKDRKFVTKYYFQAPIEDIDFGQSMVIDKNDQSFYLLATTIYEYDTYLQLLKGNLADPKLIKLGDTIPYKFHNENSYCDLFFSETDQALFEVNSLTNTENKLTEFTVRKISFPPDSTETETDKSDSLLSWILWGVLILLIVAALSVFLVRYFRKKDSSSFTNESAKKIKKAEDDQLSQTPKSQEKVSKPANSILFFGGFQVINKHGDDITKKFSPLLKELFLLIFLYSIKDKGISVPSLTELLWFSMDAKSAKNNRAVNIAKLNILLSEIDSCALNRKTGYWQIEFNDSIAYNDYWSAYKILHNKKMLSKEKLLQFLGIINKGPLLGNVSYEWLDEFKLECSNLIIDSLIQYVDQDKLPSDPELMIQLSDAILIFDMVHEDAICIKCKALTLLGKHSLAKEVFNKFSKDYLTLYNESFDRSFTDIIKY